MLISWDNPDFSTMAVFDGTVSVSSMANVVVCISVGFHTGHCASEGNLDGPNFHSVDEINCCEFIPLVRRSTGFSEVGQ